jgi:putative lipoic acid-binding regulatory protein
MLLHMEGPKRAPDRELLLSAHTFPGEYVVKAFGPGTAAFREAVHECARDVVGEERVVVRERISSGGRRMCVTLTLHVLDVDEVLLVYDRVHDVPQLMMIL